jgi:hypothetical protein
MKKSRRPSFQETLAFAATVAALGASVGVPVERVLAAGSQQDQATPGQSSAAKARATQQKADRKLETGATQMKWKANQQKEKSAKAIGGSGAAGSNVMLNPQPLPPKQGLGGNSAGQSPAIQK